MKYINNLIEKLEKQNICMKKCTKEQIEELYSFMKGKCLPKAYIEFISVMGNGTEDQYLRGDSCFMNEIYDLQQGAIELLKENESANMLADDDFVFWMSQGCMFCFFNLTEGDNPPVYFYNESGEDRFIKVAHSIVEFLVNMLEMDKDTFKEK